MERRLKWGGAGLKWGGAGVMGFKWGVGVLRCHDSLRVPVVCIGKSYHIELLHPGTNELFDIS